MTAASEDDVPSLPIGTMLGGRHRLERLLGQGAMGSVYEATGPDGVRVAVKVVRKPPGQAGWLRLARFEREARLASSLHSAHIVPVLEVGADEAAEVTFAVMPLLEGEDAAVLVRRLGPLAPATAVRITLQACEGVAVAHAAGVVHRDIKPSNLLLARGADGYTVRVGDFGVAKSAADGLNLTAPGTALGSPMYMAPEQLMSAREVDARADVWALAMTLYELLAGQPAYHRLGSFQQIVLAQSTKPVPSLQEAAPWLPAPLVAVVHGALLRELDARCPSVRALANALAPFADGATHLPFARMVGVSDAERARRPAVEQPLPGSWAETMTQHVAVPSARRLPGPPSTTSPPPLDPSAALIGQQVGERYRLEQLLGKGGMGAVYESIDARDGQRYAVKVVLEANQDADSRRRFVREAKAVRDIHSEHVVSVVDAATDPERGLPFIVMELLRGEDLAQLLKESGPLEPATTVRLFVQACEGLQAAHGAGIIHRDIKPANLFLHQLPSGQLISKICDFGVAKQTSLDTSQTSELTQTGGIIGSPMYMSPEQARNAKHVDHRTDIWSLALSLHQALSGQKPWHQTASLGELILAICTENLSPLQDAAPWIDPVLADAIHRAILRDPNERFQTIAEFQAALEPFAAPPGKVTRQALLGLSESTRQTKAPRATYGSPPTLASTSLSASAAPLPPTRPPAPFAPLAVFAAVVGIGLSTVLAVRTLRHPMEVPATPASTPVASVTAPPTATTTAAPTTSTASAQPRLRGKLLVRGTPTRVLVNGAPTELSAPGELTLEGAPGDSFLVEVEAGRVRRPADKITLGRDGTLSPPELIVAGAPVVATASSAGRTPTTTPTTQPTTAPTSTGVKPREEF